ERRVERVTAEMRSLAAGARGAYERELALLQRLKGGLEGETPIRAQALSSDETGMLAGFNLLTAKPLLVVLNLSETDAPAAAAKEAELRSRLAGEHIGVVALSAKTEADLAELEPEEAAEFRTELGLPPEPAASRLLLSAMDLLGLISFFTAGPQDTHSWS